MYKKIGVNKLVCSLEPFNLQVVVTILLIMEEDSLEHLSKKKKILKMFKLYHRTINIIDGYISDTRIEIKYRKSGKKKNI